MVIKVSKDSVRALVGKKRLPKRFRMYVIGAWLYDVLKANGLHEKFRLWNQTYWIVYRSLDARLALITWRVDR